jgi:hypothetical protein
MQRQHFARGEQFVERTRGSRAELFNFHRRNDWVEDLYWAFEGQPPPHDFASDAPETDNPHCQIAERLHL